MKKIDIRVFELSIYYEMNINLADKNQILDFY